MNSLIKIAVVLAFAAVASGNLPAVINQVRKTQFQLNQESKATNWPRAMTLPGGGTQAPCLRFHRRCGWVFPTARRSITRWKAPVRWVLPAVRPRPISSCRIPSSSQYGSRFLTAGRPWAIFPIPTGARLIS